MRRSTIWPPPRYSSLIAVGNGVKPHSFRSPQKVLLSYPRQVSWLGVWKLQLLNLPRLYEPSGIYEQLTPYSGGTAPASHWTSLLGPCRHPRNFNPNTPFFDRSNSMKLADDLSRTELSNEGVHHQHEKSGEGKHEIAEELRTKNCRKH